MRWLEFIALERASKDTIDVKRVYIDMAGDLVAGIMLSQIVYWHLPGHGSESRLQVERGGHLWLVKSRQEWWDECRVTPRQADSALKRLEGRGLIIREVHRFGGAPRTHIRLNTEGFLEAYLAAAMANGPDEPPAADCGENPKSDVAEGGKSDVTESVKSEVTESVTSLTETTLHRLLNRDKMQPDFALQNRAAPATLLPAQHKRRKRQAPPPASSPPDAHGDTLERVRAFFSERTGLAMPRARNIRLRKLLNVLWLNPLQEICELADWDYGRACGFIRESLDRLQGLTISDPNSILKTCRAVAAEEALKEKLRERDLENFMRLVGIKNRRNGHGTGCAVAE